jgi:hypothetical protein
MAEGSQIAVTVFFLKPSENADTRYMVRLSGSGRRKLLNLADEMSKSSSGRIGNGICRVRITQSPQPNYCRAKRARMGKLDDELVWYVKFGSSCAIRRQTRCETWVFAHAVIAQKPGQVNGGIVFCHRAKVDDSRDLVSREKNVLAAKIADTRLNA